MRAGDVIKTAHGNAARAVGLLSFMLERKQINRYDLEYALEHLKDACRDIETVLTPAPRKE